MQYNWWKKAAWILQLSVLLMACADGGVASVRPQPNPVVDPMIKTLPGFDHLSIEPLISSADVLEQSPDFVFGGSADGAGLIRNAAGGYTLLTNHEENFAVSRVTLDRHLKPLKGEYILNSTGGLWRLCSATMATPEEHGFGPLFLTCGESGEESRTHAIDPFQYPATPAISKEVAGLGRWNAENAVPLPKSAYPGKTVILLGDDDGKPEGGQLVMYISDVVGDLNNGRLYVIKRCDNNIIERDMVAGKSYPVAFAEIPEAAVKTGRQLQMDAVAASAIRFGRVEDLDYRKGSAGHHREIYFNVTGQNNQGVNSAYHRSKYGRTYRLVLHPTDPTRGLLECVLDGDDRGGPAASFQNPDNILVTENYVYIQEDPGGYEDYTHDAYIYQYHIATKQLRTVLELDAARRGSSEAASRQKALFSYLPPPPAAPAYFRSGEFGALLDISGTVGEPSTFLLNIKPDDWQDRRFKNPDGGTLRTREENGSQVVLIRGLER